MQLGLVTAACEEDRADMHFDTSPDFLDDDDCDLDYYCCDDEMRDYLHLNTDLPNRAAAAAVDMAEIVAAAAADDSAAGVVVAVSVQ